MDKIRITDLIEDDQRGQNFYPVPYVRTIRRPGAREKIGRLFDHIRAFVRRPFDSIDAFLKRIDVRKFNLYRRLRDWIDVRSLAKIVGGVPVEKDILALFRQPLLLVIAKMCIVSYLVFRVFEYYPLVGRWLMDAFGFFKLQEIYKFEFPGLSFFEKTAMVLMAVPIAYHGVLFLYGQLVAYFSYIAFNRATRTVYLMKSNFVKRALYAFSASDIPLIVLKQNIAGRLFGIGTLSLERQSGEKIEIRSIAGAQAALKLITGGTL